MTMPTAAFFDYVVDATQLPRGIFLQLLELMPQVDMDDMMALNQEIHEGGLLNGNVRMDMAGAKGAPSAPGTKGAASTPVTPLRNVGGAD